MKAGRPSRGGIIFSARIKTYGLAAFWWLLAAAVLPGSSGAHPPEADVRLKAAVLLKLADFVVWPDGAFADRRQPLVVCVLGDEHMAAALAALEGQQVQGRRVEVRFLQLIDDLPPCQVLFLGRGADRPQELILKGLEGSGVLTVGDTFDFVRRGGMVRLHRQRDHIRFALNQHAAKKSGITLSAKLYRLATEVIAERPVGDKN